MKSNRELRQELKGNLITYLFQDRLDVEHPREAEIEAALVAAPELAAHPFAEQIVTFVCKHAAENKAFGDREEVLALVQSKIDEYEPFLAARGLPSSGDDYDDDDEDF